MIFCLNSEKVSFPGSPVDSEFTLHSLRSLSNTDPIFEGDNL